MNMKIAAAIGLLGLGFGVQACASALDSKSIQVEQQFHGGQWVPVDPIPMDRNNSVQGRAVGEPDISLTLHPVVVDGRLALARDLEVTCRDGRGLRATFVENSARDPWNARFVSECGVWRFTLVDTAKALHMRRAAPGEFPPASASHG
ncbi:hypothetical protein IQ289_31690 [Burkholderia sp. R-70006]|uniref:hypothetical protein n=1 Tax=Paraburkholderia domus TaxID=2793075 RepID=UPI0019124F3F|nr:hypothetical protein [Paraburkholderia domus]MBK5052949.1 hypothetical protein [Burkholderia sp. R-70006]